MQQLTVFDIYPDSYCGRMSQERSVPTTEMISAVSSKKQRGSQTRMPLFLDLRGNGATAGPSWEMGIPYRGIYTTLNGGESLRDASGCVWSPISTDGQRPTYYLVLNCGEKPRESVPSRLTDILETNPDPKYQLSAKACLGILKRAEKRGKALPPELKEALEQQASRSKSGGGVDIDSHGKRAGKGALIQKELSGTLGVSQDQTLIAFGISPYSSNAMMSSNPHSGVYKADTARTLDHQGGSPTCHQGGTAIVQVLDARGNGGGEISPTITGDHQDRITDYTAIILEQKKDEGI